MVCAGVAFAWSGVATKLASDDFSTGHYRDRRRRGRVDRRGASVVGVLSEMSALQSRPAIQVAPVVFVTQTVMPVVAGAGRCSASTSTRRRWNGVPLIALAGRAVGGAARSRARRCCSR